MSDKTVKRDSLEIKPRKPLKIGSRKLLKQPTSSIPVPPPPPIPVSQSELAPIPTNSVIFLSPKNSSEGEERHGSLFSHI